MPEYTITDLDTLGGATSQAWGLNNSGQVVGQSTTSTGETRAFLTAPNSPINASTDMLPLVSGGTANFAYSVNSSGQVAGVVSTASGDRGFLYSGGVSTNLGTLGGDWSYAYAINGVGHVVGGAAISTPPFTLVYPTHAFVYDGSMHDIGTLGPPTEGGDEAYAYGINSSGKVVGYSNDAPYSPSHAFLWTPSSTNGTSGSMTDLGALGGSSSYAWGINDTGEIVGGANTAPDSTGTEGYHAFLRTTGANPSMIDLQTLGGASSEAYAINALGMVVGYSDLAASGSPTHAFIYSGGAMHDLNDLITPGSGWTLLTARGINDHAQVVGWGTDSSGQKHGYLLTPLPTWAADANGSWSDAANWLYTVPDGPGSEVRFTGAITAPRTVTLDAPHTAGHVMFDNVNAYTLAGPGTLTISGSSDSTGVEVRGGSHVISAPLEFATNAASIGLAADSGLKLAGHVTGAIGAVQLAAGSSLDITDNPLVIQYSGAAGSLVDDIRQHLQTARLNSSAADAAHKVGYGDNAVLSMGTFDGESVSSNSVLIGLTFGGDANLDGKVDVTDLGALATNWQTSSVWTGGDFNYDGFVDVTDLGILATNWQAGVAGASPASAQSFELAMESVGLGAVNVPEPSSLALALLPASVALINARRRRARPTRID